MGKVEGKHKGLVSGGSEREQERLPPDQTPAPNPAPSLEGSEEALGGERPLQEL